MKHLFIGKSTTVLIFTLICHFTLMAQKVTEEKLLGCWKVKSVEFLKPMEDSLDIINTSANMITCFEKNGKFTSKLKTGKTEELVGTGTFSIDKDGKTLNQKRDADDGGIDEPAEVSMINDHELSFKVEQLILHFERTAGK